QSLAALENLAALFITPEGGQFAMSEGMGGDLVPSRDGIRQNPAPARHIQIFRDHKQGRGHSGLREKIERPLQTGLEKRIIIALIRTPMRGKHMAAIVEFEMYRPELFPPFLCLIH